MKHFNLRVNPLRTPAAYSAVSLNHPNVKWFDFCCCCCFYSTLLLLFSFDDVLHKHRVVDHLVEVQWSELEVLF